MVERLRFRSAACHSRRGIRNRWIHRGIIDGWDDIHRYCPLHVNGNQLEDNGNRFSEAKSVNFGARLDVNGARATEWIRRSS